MPYTTHRPLILLPLVVAIAFVIGCQNQKSLETSPATANRLRNAESESATQENILDAVKPELAKRYPHDAATGFKLDELRGWFWVEVPNSAE